jgi:hypothetical protein
MVLTICIWAASIPACSSVGATRTISVVRGGLHYCPSRPPQQYRLEPLAQQVEILVAEDFALLVGDAVSVEETECGTEPPVVNEFDHREQVVESILQWRTGEHEREGRSQALHRLRRLSLPVLDTLALVQNDQIPLCSINCEDVAQHLLVIADSEKTPVPVLRSPLFGAP